MPIAAFAITPVRGGRVFWAAWWTSPPTATAFNGPDAHGVATDEHAARHAAISALARARGVRSWRAIDASFAKRADQWLRGRDPHAAAASRRRAVDARVRHDIPEIDLSPLGLAWPASLEEIRDAFRRRALTCHPDRGGAHDDMVAANRTWAAVRAAIVRGK